MAGRGYAAEIYSGPERDLGSLGRQCEWHDRRQRPVFGSGGGAEPGEGNGNGYADGRGCGIGSRDCGRANASGNLACYSDGHGGGRSGARGCGHTYRAVGQSTAETQRTRRIFLLILRGANVVFAPFLLRHIFLFWRHGEAGPDTVASSSVALPCLARLDRRVARPHTRHANL